jgi:hypothetical protein
LQVRCELFAVLLDRDVVYADRRSSAEATKRTFESWLIDEMRQRENSLIRMPLRSFRYLHQSR